MENPNYAKPRNVLLRLQLASSTTRPRSSFVFVVNQNRALANISVIKYFISDLKPTLSIRRVDEFGRFCRLLISLKAHFSYVNYFLYCWVSCRYTIHDIRKLDRNDHTTFRENSLASVFVSLCSETDVDFQYVFAHTGLHPNLSRFSIIVLSYESFALYREQKASHSFLRIGIKARLLMDVLQCTRMVEPEIQSSGRLASVTKEN